MHDIPNFLRIFAESGQIIQIGENKINAAVYGSEHQCCSEHSMAQDTCMRVTLLLLFLIQQIRAIF